jgi:hypothetical protein
MMTRPARLPLRARAALVLGPLVTLWPAVARADMVWPGLLLEQRLLTWWAVSAGLLIEAAYLGWRFRPLGPWRSLAYSGVMNAFSSALGIVLIPLATFLGLIPFGSAHPTSPADHAALDAAVWVVTVPVATAVNVAVERWALGGALGGADAVTPRVTRELAAVNAVTVLLAAASLWVRPAFP